ncbi:unnamed protein product, partial [Wuchereria bancrofti]
MDPLYGFLRTCDTTQNIEIFKENNEFQELNTYQMLTPEDELSVDERNGKLIVEIRAKCFNASFVARKYTKHCPWCSVQDEMALIESAPEYESIEEDTKMSLAKKFLQFFLGEQILLIFLLSLLLISLLGLICLLLIISKQRHFISLLQKRSQPTTNHLNSYLYSKQFAKSVKNADDRYDVPWDQQCILQRFWINDNSNIDDNKQQTMIGSRILNRPSVPTLASLAYIPRKTTITGTLSTISKKLSPNSSLCE